ncbi:MAG: M15 family metallopeptidase [Thermosynechococcaceae cyanobacterium]
MHDDIPEVIRQSVREPSRSRVPAPGRMVLGSVAALAIALIALFLLWPKGTPPTTNQPMETTAPVASATPAATAPPDRSASPEASPQDLMGHLRYDEAPADALELIDPNGSIQLRRAAAAAYRKMADAAAADGVRLQVISGFRSIADQTDLFFRVKEERNQSATRRAEVSAPPQYSEHHTGYAVDIGDADRPDTQLSQSFEETPAFQWLSNHAAQYSFELSFTRNNAQGVSYEPWHWRFVGDQHSLETFYRAQHLGQSSAP